MMVVSEIYNTYLRGRSQAQYFREPLPLPKSQSSPPALASRSLHHPHASRQQSYRPSDFRDIADMVDDSDEVADSLPVEAPGSFSALTAEPQVCCKHLLGKCTFPPGQCRYSHDPAHLRAFCSREVAKLMASPFYVPAADFRTTQPAVSPASPMRSSDTGFPSRTRVASKIAAAANIDEEAAEAAYLDAQLG